MQRNLTFIHITVFAFISLLNCTNGFAQTRIVTGLIIDANMERLPEVKIHTIDTTFLGTTKLDGTFEIELPVDSCELLISWIGMESQKALVPKDCNKINVLLMFDGNYCYSSNRKNERERRKYLAQQPKLLEQAYDQGIFNINEKCR